MCIWFKNVLLSLALLSIATTCLAGVDMIVSGKHRLPTVGCSYDPDDWVVIKFPKTFGTIPTVVVTQDVPSGAPWADSFLSTSAITKQGFSVQRRNYKNEVCNEVITVNYIAIGN